MGFPMDFKELRLPAIILYALYVLAFFIKLIATLCPNFGLTDSLAHEFARSDPTQLTHLAAEAEEAYAAAVPIIDEIVPVVRHADLQSDPEDGCSICLVEFGPDDQIIRRLSNCRHVFHRRCLDRWIVVYRKMTCPVCRDEFVPSELRENFNQTVWGSGSGVYGLYGETSGYNGFNFLE